MQKKEEGPDASQRGEGVYGEEGAGTVRRGF